MVFGGTGPVGQRVCLLLAKKGAKVYLGSRSIGRAEDTCEEIRKRDLEGSVEPFAVDDAGEWIKTVGNASIVVAAGAAGVQLLSKQQLEKLPKAHLLVDLNAVPPAGIEGIGAHDYAKKDGPHILFGALGIGGYKMEIHKAAIGRLFESNDVLFDAEELFPFAQALLAP